VTALRWALADGWTITRRDIMHWGREPGPVIFGILFPVLIALMFAYLLGGAMIVPGGGDYREFLVPGMFGMNMLFGIGATMLSVHTDARRGVTDRFRSMPMSPVAVLAGRSAADLLHSVLGLAVLLGCGLLVGWRAHGGMAALLGAVALLLLLRFAVLWLGIYLGLVVKGPESVVAAQILVWPVAFLASAIVSPETMPGWLGAIAEWNPISPTITAIRDLFGNPGAAGTSWATRHALPLAVGWPAVLLAIFGPLSVWRYRNLNR
jgi:ABC-2 type transport system permease protein